MSLSRLRQGFQQARQSWPAHEGTQGLCTPSFEGVTPRPSTLLPSPTFIWIMDGFDDAGRVECFVIPGKFCIFRMEGCHRPFGQHRFDFSFLLKAAGRRLQNFRSPFVHLQCYYEDKHVMQFFDLLLLVTDTLFLITPNSLCILLHPFHPRLVDSSIMQLVDPLPYVLW